MKKLIILSLFIIIANNIFAQQSYWDKAEAKYQSDYRERIRTNMYIKAESSASNYNFGNNDLLNSLEQKRIEEADARTATIEANRLAREKREAEKDAIDSAKYLAEKPARDERIRKGKLMTEYIISTGITAFEAEKLVSDFNYYDYQLTLPENDNTTYYKTSLEKCKERFYIGDYKKLFSENISSAPYDSLNNYVSILTNNGAPLTALDLSKELKTKFPNKTNENDNLQTKIYQVIFAGFVNGTFNYNSIQKQMADSYLEFENNNLQIYLKLLEYCGELGGTETPYDAIIKATKKFDECYNCSGSEKREAKNYFKMYSERKKSLDEKVFLMLSNSNPITLDEQVYLNKIARGMFNKKNLIYISSINRSIDGIKKIASIMNVTPMTVIKDGAGLPDKQRTIILDELLENNDGEAFENSYNTYYNLERYFTDSDYLFYISDKKNKKIPAAKLKLKEILLRKASEGNSTAMRLIINDNLKYVYKYCLNTPEKFLDFENIFKSYAINAPEDSVVTLANVLAQTYYVNYNEKNRNPHQCEILLWEFGIKKIKDLAILGNKSAINLVKNFNLMDRATKPKNGYNAQKIDDGFYKKFYSDTSFYEGDFKNGQCNGKGFLLYSDGVVYEGDFLNDKANGFGKQTWPDGTTYVGEFKDFQLHGKGKVYFADGSLNFEGEHFNSKKIGAAKLYFNDTKENLNITYNDAGQWIDGTYTFTKTSKYKKIGTWFNNKWNYFKYYDSKGNIISEDEYNKN